MNYINKFNGNGTSTIFQLTGMPISPQSVSAEFDGYPKTYGQDFCIQTNFIIFIEKPSIGVDNVIVQYDGEPLSL